MYNDEATHLERSSARWRGFARTLAALGFLGIAVLSFRAARAVYYGGFSVSQFVWTFLTYGLIFLAAVWPLFLAAQLMRGLAAALRGRAADWLHPRPETWRSAAWALTILGGLGAAAAAYAISEAGRQAGVWEGTGTPFLLAFPMLFLGWMLEVWPLFALRRVLDAVSLLPGQAPGVPRQNSAARQTPAPPMAEAPLPCLGPTVFAPCPACGRPINRDLSACPYCRADPRREAPPEEPPGVPPETLV